jgi:hypothetical protein
LKRIAPINKELKLYNMRRTEGSKGIALIECINPYIGKYRIRWDVQPKEVSENDYEAVTFYEAELTKRRKPTIEEVKSLILIEINKMIDEKILSGFAWKGMEVWLSSENQFNYKAAYDLTLQSEGKTLPVLFKFGSTEEPIYHRFETIEELSDFYIGAMKYISDTLAEGWKEKDSIDWSLYEEVLRAL